MFSRVFKAFEYRDFRVMWFGACTSSIGTWMQQLAQAWLVLQLSGSAFLLGFDSFLGQIPIVFLSLIGGVIADRTERRKLLLASQWVQMACAFTLAFVFAAGLVKVWHILALSFVVGMAQSFGGPAYQALIPSLVKTEDLPNAIALNSIQFNLARVIGPALGGFALARWGATWCFGLNGASFVAVIISLLMIKTRYIPGKTGESVIESMKGGIRFIRKQAAMVSLIVLAFLMTMFAIPLLVFLPVFARDVLHGGPTTFTWLLASSGVGSVCGALGVAALGKFRKQGRAALFLLMALGVTITAFSFTRVLLVSCAMVFIAGAMLMGVFATISSLVQMITADGMRGRVMSVYTVAFRGGMPIGSLVDGALVKHYSAPLVLGVNGVILVFLGAYFLVAHRRISAL